MFDNVCGTDQEREAVVEEMKAEDAFRRLDEGVQEFTALAVKYHLS